MNLARQLPADRYLAVTTLKDDGAEGDSADHFYVGSFLEPEARELTTGGRIIDRLDSSPAAYRYAVYPHPSLRRGGLRTNFNFNVLAHCVPVKPPGRDASKPLWYNELRCAV